jgi:hypothetical protein
MRHKGTSEELAVVRARGLALLEKGKKPQEVAEILNVTPSCVYRWRRESKEPRKKKSTRPPGRPRKLSETSEKIEKGIDKGAYAFRVCRELLDAGSHRSGSGSYLKSVTIRAQFGMMRRGWSNQRPQR